MTEFIYKLFVKDKDNISSAKVRARYGVVSGAVGIGLNVLLFLIKLISGIMSSSISIMADAINNLSDALSSVITIVGFKLAGKKPDTEHPFGHGRAEYVSALFVSVLIGVMGFELFKSSVVKIFSPEEIKYNLFVVIFLIVAIGFKLWLYFFFKYTGRKISSQSIIASSKDALSDCVATVSVILGLVAYRLFSINIDGYIGVGVSVFILYTGYITLKESLSPLLGIAPTKEMVAQIKEIVMNSPGIVGMHDLVIHNYGPSRFMLSLHAEVRSDRNVLNLHEEIDSLERELNDTLGCESVIHMDPVETENEEVNHLRCVICDIMEEIDAALSVHDLRITGRKGEKILIFDVLVPFEFKLSFEELDKIIKAKINEYNSGYRIVIEYDNSYV